MHICWVDGKAVELGSNYLEPFVNFTTYNMIMSFPVNGFGLPSSDLPVPFETSADPTQATLFARGIARVIARRRATLLDGYRSKRRQELDRRKKTIIRHT